MVANHIISLLCLLACMINSARSGFSNSPLTYSAAFTPSPYLPYDAPPPTPPHFAAPLPVDYADGYSQALPVAPITVNSYAETTHHTYAAPPTPTFVKYHSGFSPFRTYSSQPSKFRFAGSSHFPSVYSAPLPYGLSSSASAYNGFGAHNSVVKFGPPITTTTTTYSAAAAGAVAPVVTPFAAPYAGRIGW